MDATKRAEASATNVPLHLWWPSLLTLALVMALALPTEPLFFGNQNTKFLHGLAAAGHGELLEDWQANTRNGLPLFTALVEGVVRLAGPRAFYVLQAGAVVALAAALLAWHRRVAADAGLGTGLFVPTVLVLALLHSNQGTAELFEGVAKQSIAGRILEPANIGVLLLAGALALHVRRPLLGAAALAAAAAVHPGYVLPAAVLLSAGLVAYGGDQRRRRVAAAAALGVGGLALNAWLLARAFPATSPELATEAARILTELRIPHHSQLAHWFDIDAAAKLGLACLAVALTRGRALGYFLAIALLLTPGLSLATLAPGTAPLRLVAPWRTSVALVPIANVVVLTYGLAWLTVRIVHPRRWAAGVVAVTTVVVAYNLVHKVRGYAEPEASAHHAWFRRQQRPGLVVMTPVHDQDFRLATGVPQYVSFKSHPYQDHEVLEWRRRVEVARAVQAHPADSCGLLRGARRRAGLTHVVWPREKVETAPCPFLERVYTDPQVVVFAWRRPG